MLQWILIGWVKPAPISLELNKLTSDRMFSTTTFDVLM